MCPGCTQVQVQSQVRAASGADEPWLLAGQVAVKVWRVGAGVPWVGKSQGPRDDKTHNGVGLENTRRNNVRKLEGLQQTGVSSLGYSEGEVWVTVVKLHNQNHNNLRQSAEETLSPQRQDNGTGWQVIQGLNTRTQNKNVGSDNIGVG
ncbi:hypothetical protein C0Q70_14371 [Pomacea canaliculata]|uniref:Uncharacterized protein n=1 Tax=Pomacea canaliculata TaxID=400727 RepID=A0A2T7NZW9_POMCA|nr:hypothetical protein C0Q70_14371 [Pomacea canaliculata]